jgi:hypothetical protein
MIAINSLDHLEKYLTTLGVKILERDIDSLRVTDGLFIAYDNISGYVIPSGFDNGWLYK